ncbi:MAG: DUF1214 domain-containing protein [Gammaproteobacteria bacterium]
MTDSRSGSPTIAPGTVAPWDEYVALLRNGGDLPKLTWAPGDDQVRAEVYRQIVMNITLGYFIYFQHDAAHPDWLPFLNSVFLLQPNPDDTYYLAHLDDKGTYRITGERGSVHILTFTFGYEPMGTSERIGGGLGQFDADELHIAADGSFGVLLSATRPAGHTGDWVQLPAGCKSIIARQRSYDWGRERDARLAIERLDVTELKPRMPAAEIDRNLRELLGGYAERLSRIWLKYQTMIRDQGPINTINFTKFGGALPVQTYWQGVYEFKPDEALILETDIPKKHRYWNVQMNDILWNATEYIHRQSSLNGHQARLDPDGRFRAVISLEDPGIHNWLDSAGYLTGMVIGRWYLADSLPVPTLKRVPFAEIHKHLPADTPRITPAERAEALRRRKVGSQLRRRW